MNPDTPLKGLPIAVIDVETTGFDPADHRVVDVAVVHLELGDEGDPRVAFASLVNPCMPIPPEVTRRVHNIGDADVADAPIWAGVADQVEAALRDRVVLAHNVPFDYAMLAAEQRRAGRAPIPLPWIDTLVVRKALRTRGKPGRLAEICADYRIDVDAHGAVADALATAELAPLLLRDLFRVRGYRTPAGNQPDDDPTAGGPTPRTIGAFLAWQDQAALWQERDYARWCRERGDAAPPSQPWAELLGQAQVTWPPPHQNCQACGGPVVRKIRRDGTRYFVDLADGQPHSCRGSSS